MIEIKLEPSKIYSFQPTRLGYICQFIEPLSCFETLEMVRSMFEKDPDLSSVPIEKDGGVSGLLSREVVIKKSDSALEVFRSRSLDQYMKADVLVLDALESIERALAKVLDKSNDGAEHDFLIYHNGKFLGVGSYMGLIRHSAVIRSNDLEKAKTTQEYLMNLHPLPTGEISVSRYVKMVHELGGDFFQCQEIRPGLQMVACFDVSGKGVAAALTTSIISSFFSTLEINGSLASTPPVQLVEMLNKLIMNSSADSLFVAAGIIFLDSNVRKAQIFNLALGPIYIFHQGEGGKPLCSTLAPNLPPLGIDDLVEPEKNCKTIPWLKGMKIFMNSDGLTDVRNTVGEMYGEETLKKFLFARHGTPGKRLIEELEAEITAFIGVAPQADDVSAITIQVG